VLRPVVTAGGNKNPSPAFEWSPKTDEIAGDKFYKE
jgi:hypothetical protein